MQIKFYRLLRAVMVIIWILIGVIGSTIDAAERNRIPEDMWQNVRARGVLAVLVKLNVPLKPLGYLTPEERIAQRDAIIAAQDQLLVELTGTQYTVIHRYNYVDGFALNVGPDALKVLANSSLVTSITEDIPGSPS